MTLDVEPRLESFVRSLDLDPDLDRELLRLAQHVAARVADPPHAQETAYDQEVWEKIWFVVEKDAKCHVLSHY